MKQFPNFKSVAQTQKRSVLIAWDGLGYNRRALYLLDISRSVVATYNGQLPESIEELERLPGIGKYSSRAILSFAFQKKIPVIDVNVRRVLSRVFWRMQNHIDVQVESRVWKKADEVLPPRSFYDWNQALMDFGAIVCTRKNPKCLLCPITNHCKSRSALLHAKVTRQKNHSSRKTPRRIYRGRVISYLRKISHRKEASFEEIGKVLLPSFAAQNYPWLLDILRSLEKDSLIDSFIAHKSVSLMNFAEKPTTLQFSLAQ